MKVAVLFSGGKDSTMALYNALETGEDVKYLLSMKSVNDESYMFHVPNIHITDLLAEALNIPIITAQTQGIKEEELEDLKMAFIKLKDLGVEAIYTGALYSVYQKSRIEKLGDEVGLEIISPYWHVDELEYMKEIVSLGFEVIISGVFAYGLDESWLGRKIDDMNKANFCILKFALFIHRFLIFRCCGIFVQMIIIVSPLRNQINSRNISEILYKKHSIFTNKQLFRKCQTVFFNNCPFIDFAPSCAKIIAEVIVGS